MKFHQLAIASSFTYQGIAMVKTGPLVATYLASGQQKFMPRSAIVEPRYEDQQATAMATLPASQQLDLARVETAFDHFYQTCLQNLGNLAPHIEANMLEDIHKDLAKARLQFLQKL